MQPDEWDAKAREMARAILLDTQAIQVEGTSDNASGYGPPYKAPWYIMDTSKAEPEVNWPGELIEIVTDPGMISKRLMAAREKIALLVICEAYQRGRNEAVTLEIGPNGSTVMVEPVLRKGLTRRVFRYMADGSLEWAAYDDWRSQHERARFFGFASRELPASMTS